jgi:hypothetical protein
MDYETFPILELCHVFHLNIVSSTLLKKFKRLAQQKKEKKTELKTL